MERFIESEDVGSASRALVQLQRHLTDLSACLEWVLAQQISKGSARYPDLVQRAGQLSLPLRWLAERMQMELAVMQDELTLLRDYVDAGDQGLPDL